MSEAGSEVMRTQKRSSNGYAFSHFSSACPNSKRSIRPSPRCFWPIATDRILVAERRFRGITDMAGAAAGRTRTRMTQFGH